MLQSVDDVRVSMTDPHVTPVDPHVTPNDPDLQTCQHRLQHEATLALAQIRPMAHMQLMVEKRVKKRSPLADIVSNVTSRHVTF